MLVGPAGPSSRKPYRMDLGWKEAVQVLCSPMQLVTASPAGGCVLTLSLGSSGAGLIVSSVHPSARNRGAPRSSV